MKNHYCNLMLSGPKLEVESAIKTLVENPPKTIGGFKSKVTRCVANDGTVYITITLPDEVNRIYNLVYSFHESPGTTSSKDLWEALQTFVGDHGRECEVGDMIYRAEFQEYRISVRPR